MLNKQLLFNITIVEVKPLFKGFNLYPSKDHNYYLKCKMFIKFYTKRKSAINIIIDVYGESLYNGKLVNLHYIKPQGGG